MGPSCLGVECIPGCVSASKNVIRQPTGKGDYYIDSTLTVQWCSPMTSIWLQQQVDRELSYCMMTHQKQSQSRALTSVDNRDIIVSVVLRYKMKQVQQEYAATT